MMSDMGVDDEMQRSAANRVSGAITELNAAISRAAECGLLVMISDYSVQQIQDRFDRRVYRAEVFSPLT